jgi:pSer/pThr/pTyr-binding forkhead associated (FHA) protein
LPFVVDLGSTNGRYINGEQLDEGGLIALVNDAFISFGSLDFRLKFVQ